MVDYSVNDKHRFVEVIYKRCLTFRMTTTIITKYERNAVYCHLRKFIARLNQSVQILDLHVQ